MSSMASYPLPTDLLTAGDGRAFPPAANRAWDAVNRTRRGAAYAYLGPVGAGYEAWRSTDGGTISSNASLATVFNAAASEIAGLANGGRLELTHGLFTVDNQLVVPNPGRLALVGQGGNIDYPSGNVGAASVLKCSAGFSAAQMFSMGGAGASAGAHGCLLEDFTVDMNGKSAYGVKAVNCHGLKLNRVMFQGPGQGTTDTRAIWVNSDQAVNNASGAEAEITWCKSRDWWNFLYVGAVNGKDGWASATSVGAADGRLFGNESWSTRRTVTCHHGGWLSSQNHWVGNLAGGGVGTDYHLYTNSQINSVGDYYDSVKAGGWAVEVDVGCVHGNISNGWYIIDSDPTCLGVRFTAQRNNVVNNRYKAGTGGVFLKFTNAGNGGFIWGNTGEGPTSDATSIQSSAGASLGGITGSSGAGFAYGMNFKL
jgi:hypothetical protein